MNQNEAQKMLDANLAPTAPPAGLFNLPNPNWESA